jgi:hypothetical protein
VSNFKLNLPTDIPWVRKCVSTDMLDRNLCDKKTAYRWRSSIAVFEYEPEAENQSYEGRVITYLKVSCTVTGYQEDPKEIGLDRKGVRSYWAKSPAIENYLNVLEAYYPCYGAILEVAVGPEDEKHTALEDYPYFLDFEPKKRELYELVTDTGETMSRSLEGVALGKSNTSTVSHEIVDIDKGWSAAANVEYAGVKVGASGSRQYESGTRDVTQEQSQNVRSSDASQESRETQSHTTQLTQMYHQLDSYHLGTNRAVFFIHPRPHTIENEHTFVNGPRNIEGIQEFMFVVVRPKTVTGLCVEAYLETGHIGKIPHAELEELPGTEQRVIWSDKFHAQPKGDDDSTTVFDDKDRVWDVASHNPGYKIKSVVFTAGPATIRYNYDKPNLIDIHPHISAQNEDFIVVSGKVHSGFANYGIDSDRWEEIDYLFSAEIVLVKKQVVQRSEDTLFMTARRLCCCKQSLAERLPINSGIVYERSLDKAVVEQQRSPGARVPIAVANLHAKQIQEAVIRSRVDLDHRHEAALTLPQTDFAAQTAARGLRSVADMKIADVTNMPPRLQQHIKALGTVTTREVLGMPARMLQDVLNVSAEDAIELRSTVLGIVNTEYDYRKAWLSDDQIDHLFGEARKSKPRRKS